MQYLLMVLHILEKAQILLNLCQSQVAQIDT
jgi:hypothetical protein